MKKTFLSRCLALAMATVLSASAYGQIALPPDFEDQQKKEYDKSSKEIDFPAFYKTAVFEYERTQLQLKDPSLIFHPGVIDPGIIVLPGKDITCTGGTFESGIDTTYWKGADGLVQAGTGTILFGGFSPGISSGPLNSTDAHQTIVDNSAPDPITGISQVAPGGSTKAVRLGNTAIGRGAELLEKTFKVTATNSNISFWYALVLQNPNDATHTGVNIARQPSFQVRVLDHDNGNAVIPGVVNLDGLGHSEILADSSNPFFRDTTFGQQPLVYRDWSCAQINLSDYIGKTVVVQFVNKDCSEGGHFGYTYLDNFCGNCNVVGSSNGTITPGKITCGNGGIGYSYTVPQAPVTGLNGTVKLTLRIYQNGALVQTLNSPTFGTDGSYTFPISTAPPINASLTGFDYTVTAEYTLNGVPLAPNTIGIPATGQNTDQNDDYSISCNPQCCPGTNLITNGTFEAGNTGFTSAYTYQAPGASANSVSTGEYSVLNSTEAQAIASTWIPGCGDFGRQLIVNGATEVTTSPKIVWQQTVNIPRGGGTFKFCGDFRKLVPCAFSASSRITVNFLTTGLGGSQSSPIPSINSTLSNTTGCSWTTLERTFTIPSGISSLQITILLTEAVTGDGNDVAIDNLNLVAQTPVPDSAVLFSIVPAALSSTTYKITATATSPLGSGCEHYWKVEELDANGNPITSTQVDNPSAWQSLGTNTFIGYTGTSTLSNNGLPGVFYNSKTYQITYGRTCPCQEFNSRAYASYPVASKGVSGLPTFVEVPKMSAATRLANPAASEGLIKVFPNPADNKVTVLMPALSSAATLKLFNSTGQLLKETALQAGDNQTELSLQELPSGIYLLQMANKQGEMILNRKITKL